ncbi:hypothetical protein IRT45_24305 [Nocardia sp. BSTN01]|uniref:hypothetical protein n=1 Tax=Nocardia sp. BSTN01 TaxID=2783665 RepID=UPI00188EB4EA|nr:hypothetical protein [Nocardia sp. BSTN01]MBF5000272.1 hypothetical protein [Nocardia sp. BSTN01]
MVVLDSDTELFADATPYLVDGGEPANAASVVRKHLRLRLSEDQPEVLKHDDVSNLLTHVTEHRPATRDLALLADQLADVAAGRIDISDLIAQRSSSVDDRFRQWFDSDLDAETRAFAIALAVFNGMPLHIVTDAGRRLATLIELEEIPDESRHVRSVFGLRTADLLTRMHAQLEQTVEDTRYGRIAVEAVKFIDDHVPGRVLEYVWREYPAAHRLVRSWLRELGDDPDIRVCARAGVAAGKLSIFEFEYARELVIEPWADSGAPHERVAAIGALQFPGTQPELAPLVTRMLTAWLRSRQPLSRRITAAAALGSTVGRTMPDRALQLLRKAAASTELPLRDGVCFGVLQLFNVAELTGRVLEELAEWTGSRKSRVRDTAFHCALEISASVHIETPRGSRAWPAVVWLSDESAHLRSLIVTIFARMAQAPFYMPEAYDEIRRWVRMSERDPNLRKPIGKLLIELNHAIPEPDILQYHLKLWADETAGPVHAVDELLTMLETRYELQ